MIGTSPRPPQRFPATLLVIAGATFAACGGGGGGGPPPNAAPTIVTAAFVGSGPAPVAGDTLLLAFSETVALVPAALLTDADVELTAGATLGDVTQPPSLLSANTVALVLGPGVALTPGVTTITLRTPGSGAPGNDVVRDGTGQLGVAGAAVVLGTSDGAPPSLTNLTAAGVDDVLNGSGPAGGVLQVPANGFTIDLAYSDNTAIATARTQITASVAVGTPSGSQPAGTNLVPFLTQVAADNTTASYRVPAGMTFPNGPLTLTAVVADASGLGSTPLAFAATVRAFDALRQPFETQANPSQVWFLEFTRDIESYTVAAITGGFTVDVVAGANSLPDFVDLLRVLGLNAAVPLPNVDGSRDSNQVVVDRFGQALLAELASLYAGANVTFTLTAPTPGFGASSSVPYASLGHSRISIAGSSTTTGVLGIAIFDPNNETQNDNTRLDFAQTTRLGIFLHTIVDSGFGPPASNLFRQTFAGLAPALGGTPIGADPADGGRLTGATTDARATAIDVAIADLARFTAVVTAHECGHSMGLVQNGAMPIGLHGNDTVNFPGSSDGHIRNAATFPVGSTNVMSPSLSYNATLSPATAFNTLNLAYLREQVTYGN